MLDAVLEQHPGLPAIVVTGFGTVDTAVEAMKHGATDFLTKPIETESLPRHPRPGDRAGERERRPGDAPVAGRRAEMDRLGIVGDSRAMLELFDTRQAARPAPVRPFSSSVRVGRERS